MYLELGIDLILTYPLSGSSQWIGRHLNHTVLNWDKKESDEIFIVI